MCGMEQYYTVIEVSNILNLCHLTVRRLIKTGKLSAINVGTGKKNLWRISKTKLNEFMK